MAPEANLIIVKLAASITSPPSAILQRTEFAAKAIRAKVVYPTVFLNDMSDLDANIFSIYSNILTLSVPHQSPVERPPLCLQLHESAF